jgi:4-hydroxyphenylpyruvate dioxygenase
LSIAAITAVTLHLALLHAPPYLADAAGLKRIDHIVGNVEYGAMDRWVNFFVKTMGFDVRMHFDDQAISTEYSALMSKVLENGSKTIININEPAPGRRKSQIQEYLDFHYGAGNSTSWFSNR